MDKPVKKTKSNLPGPGPGRPKGVRDVEGREHLHRYLKVIGQFEAAFRAHLETGQLAAAAIRAEEEQKTLMERIKERVRG